MKKTRSFFTRWLTTLDKERQEHSVIDVEHVQSGDKWRVSTIEEANEWMKNAVAPSTDETETLPTG